MILNGSCSVEIIQSNVLKFYMTKSYAIIKYFTLNWDKSLYDFLIKNIFYLLSNRKISVLTS